MCFDIVTAVGNDLYKHLYKHRVQNRMTVEDTIKEDIRSFLSGRQTLFFNEGDLQIQLSVYLMRSGNYQEVNVEYYVPFNQLDGYLWKNELYIDIVVRRGDDYVAVELKYPTKKIVDPISRFGEELPEVTLLKEHSAQDIVQYNFWKDVRRMELLKKRFPSVKKGLAVLLTNDMLYMKPRRKGVACEQFSTTEGMHNTSRHWNTHKKWMDKGYPDFDLDGEYAIEWQHCNFGRHEFIYCMIDV